MGIILKVCSCYKDQMEKEKDNEISAIFTKRFQSKKNFIINNFLNDEVSIAENELLKSTDLGLGVQNVRYFNFVLIEILNFL